MIDPVGSQGKGDVARRGIAGFRDELLLAACRRAMKGATNGAMRLTLPSGATTLLGCGGTDEPHVNIKSFAALWKSLRGGAIGFAESYMAGDFDVSDLDAVFRYFLTNWPNIDDGGFGLSRVKLSDRVFHSRRQNTYAGSRRNIAAHYDLGNAFFTHWLDRSMMYSSAYYARAGMSLEDAQAEKIDRVLDALELEPRHKLLEIGCGWGSFAQRAAQSGAEVTAITVSNEQFAHCAARQAGPAPVDVRLCDYRDVSGVYDRIASIEMIEAVGERNWPKFFEKLHHALKPGGVAVLQAITIREQIFERYRRTPDFIQRYIFPGGMLPTISAMSCNARASGLSFETLASFGDSYARTLREWRRRFEAAWPAIERLGFDERFRRMWTYYLTYCEVAFEAGEIDVGHYRLSKP